jgi:putative intracellular protease/amidase
MTKGKVLVIGSNATALDVQGGGTVETGQYLNETVVPAMAIEAAGYEIVLATPTGAKPTIDPVSDAAEHFGGDEAVLEKARDYYAHSPAMNDPKRLSDVVEAGLDDFAGVFVPGGHAPIADLMQDADVGRALAHFHAGGKPTALLCHGPIALAGAAADPKAFRAALVAGDDAAAAKAAGDWPYRGYRMTIFSASEEAVAEAHILKAKLHFDMPRALTAAGGIVETGAENFAPYVVTDRELITGQNPASDQPIARAFVEALDKRG